MSSRTTQVGMYFCPGENYLEQACTHLTDLALDINEVRTRVANGEIQGKSVKETIQLGIEAVEADGALAARAKQALTTCLGRIANQACRYYSA